MCVSLCPPTQQSSLCVQDWDAMVSLLLDDKAGIVLSGQEETVLIEILTCAVRRAARLRNTSC